MRPFQKLPGTRRSAFEDIDRPALKALPALAYQFAEWKKAVVNIDYHVELDLRYTENTVECFYKNTRLASHIRSYLPGRHTTLKEHMPAHPSALAGVDPGALHPLGPEDRDRPVPPSFKPSSAPGRIPSRASVRR